MAYETKALLVAISNIVRLSDQLSEHGGGAVETVYEALEEIAAADGVKLKPLKDKKEESGEP